MPKKRLGAEQIVTKLRQVEVMRGLGQERCRDLQGSGSDRAELLPIPEVIRWFERRAGPQAQAAGGRPVS
jgi:hypothetical protein